MNEASEFWVECKSLIARLDSALARNDAHIAGMYFARISSLCARSAAVCDAEEYRREQIRALDAWTQARKAELSLLEPEEVE